MQRFAILLLTLFSTAAFGQAGSLTYAPVSVTPTSVPVPSLFLIPLGLIMAAFGVRAIKKHGNAILGAFLGILGTAAVVSGGVLVQDAIAGGVIVINLDNAAGGTVTLVDNVANYVNTTGAPATITAITHIDLARFMSGSASACTVGMQLESNELCDISYCPVGYVPAADRGCVRDL